MTEQYFGISIDDIVGHYQEIVEKQVGLYLDTYQEEIEKTNGRPVDAALLQLHVQKYTQILMDKIHIYLQNYLFIDEESAQIASQQGKTHLVFDEQQFQDNLNVIIDAKNQAKTLRFGEAVQQDIDRQAVQTQEQQQAFKDTYLEKKNMLQRLSEQIIKEGELGDVLLRSRREQQAEKEKGKKGD